MPTCVQTKAVIEGWGTMTVLTRSIKQRHYYPNIKPLKHVRFGDKRVEF